MTYNIGPLTVTPGVPSNNILKNAPSIQAIKLTNGTQFDLQFFGFGTSGGSTIPAGLEYMLYASDGNDGYINFLPRDNIGAGGSGIVNMVVYLTGELLPKGSWPATVPAQKVITPSGGGGPATSVVNDGNPATVFVEGTLQGNSLGSNVALWNTGEFVLQEYTGTGLNTLLHVVPNASPPGSTNVAIGKGGYATEIIGQLQVDQAAAFTTDLTVSGNTLVASLTQTGVNGVVIDNSNSPALNFTGCSGATEIKLSSTSTVTLGIDATGMSGVGAKVLAWNGGSINTGAMVIGVDLSLHIAGTGILLGAEATGIDATNVAVPNIVLDWTGGQINAGLTSNPAIDLSTHTGATGIKLGAETTAGIDASLIATTLPVLKWSSGQIRTTGTISIIEALTGNNFRVNVPTGQSIQLSVNNAATFTVGPNVTSGQGVPFVATSAAGDTAQLIAGGVTLAGGTAGNAIAYFYIRGTVRVCIIKLIGFRTAGAAQVLALPTNFVQVGTFFRVSDCELFQFMNSGTAITSTVVITFPAAAGSPGTTSNGTTMAGWTHGQVGGSFNQISFNAGWTNTHNGTIVLEGA